MLNMFIRNTARGANIPLWLIAQHMGKSESTMTRMLRRKLTSEERERILAAIREIRAERRAKAHATIADTDTE